MIVSAEVYYGNQGDTHTIEDTVNSAKTHLRETCPGKEVQEVVADNGYHSEQVLDVLQNESDLRTYIPEPDRKYQRTWTDKSPQREAAYRRNRRRTKGNRGR
ncbi:MAG: transposase [Rhodopirellula bahusiensis]